MSKARLATTRLDGCSGCHMSFLDMDERLIEVAPLVDLVHSLLVDSKEFPDNVDVVLVEGAVSSEDDLEKIRKVCQRSKVLLSLGDCAVTANVPSMRNRFPVVAVEHRAYIENAQLNQQLPQEVVPQLLPKSRPVHEFVKVDVFAIYFVLTQILGGRMPDLTNKTRFGA
jgi:NAD-reducing hydrogenase small subunit